MTDVQQARIEAAARAMWGRSPREGDPTWADLDYGIKEIWRKDAHAALQADDAVVTVDMIVDELAGHPIGSGNYQTTVSVDEAREMAEIIQRLYRGEEQS